MAMVASIYDSDDAVDHDGDDGALLRQCLVEASDVMAIISSLARYRHASIVRLRLPRVARFP